MTQVRSTQTAAAQDISPRWPCSAAVSRMWVSDPAPAMTAATVTVTVTMHGSAGVSVTAIQPPGQPSTPVTEAVIAG